MQARQTRLSRWRERIERYDERRRVTKASLAVPSKRLRDSLAQPLVGRDADEPAAGEDGLATAELYSELLGLEIPLVHLPARAVLEQPLLPFLPRKLLPPSGVEDDELRRHAPRLGEETAAFLLVQMAVEVTREEAIERAVVERQLEGIADDVLIGCVALARDLDHARPLVESRP